MEDETTIDDLMAEFDFQVEGAPVDPNLDPPKPKEDDVPPTPPTEGKTEEEIAAEAAAKAKEDEGKEDVPPTPTADDVPSAPAGKSGSFYKELALKYMENGTWDKGLAIEDGEGNQVALEDVEDLNEETFFAIQKTIEADREEERKTRFLPIDKLDERRKNLVTIVAEGGDLSEIFKSETQVEQYLNPFSNLDLEDPNVQERVYLNSLMKYNNLEQDVAQEVVNKAKKDLTLDSKVKTFVDNYTKKLDEYVESKKQEVIEDKKKRQQELKEFGKSLNEQYKNYELSDTLRRKLTNSAVKETENGFEIDAIYEQKMQDPAEAAELILFLNDKEAYLQNKTKGIKTQESKKVMKLIKMIPDKSKKAKEEKGPEAQVDDEFDFQVVPN